MTKLWQFSEPVYVYGQVSLVSGNTSLHGINVHELRFLGNGMATSHAYPWFIKIFFS